jgi:[ribosomal protein S5]-alanine N-acetyltransferase
MKSIDYLETERTFLRKLTVDDAENFYALNLDELVLKYTGDKPFENIQSAQELLKNYDQYEKYGVGRLAVIEKETLKFMGWCGLKYSPVKNEYNIGFRFFRHYWNLGFATETAKKCLENADRKLGIERVVGRAMKENSASIQVLEKIGMKFKEPIDFNGREGVLYEYVSVI